ncbi:outer membrane protein [Geofilum rubicundum JCM 15548]|uniref:Outer membrane protein n=2 Tax=Geofilum TaxID=1236988 RepID=A0A0E9LW55_9BACT|nr:outer membrane protein [Geofilum rubicundum JCM 15548]
MLAAVSSVGIGSCSDDFLKEEITTSYSLQHFETEEGLNDLAVSLYGNIRYHFAYEWAYGFTNYGTDEFSSGTDLTSEMWNTYDSRLAPYVSGAANKNYPSPDHLWDQMYFGINSAI